MTRHHGFVRSIAITAGCTVGLVLVLRAADPPNFKPDGSFKGSALTGWHVVGDAEWTAQNGEIVGKAKSGTNGGWLVMDKSFQDVQLYLNYKCTGECKSGVLLRAKKAADGSMTAEEWDAVINVHLRGTFAPSRWAAAYWRDRAKAGEANDARIINTTSVSGIYGNPGQTNYGAAKMGIAAFTIIASRELGRYGVTVNAVAPGALTRMSSFGRLAP